MNRPSTIIRCALLKKTATVLLLTASLAAFATLGGDRQGKKQESSVLLPLNAKNFSLRSNYNYRSNNLFAAPAKKEFIMLNPVVTYQTGNSAYIVPLKKLPLMGKIKFTTTPQKF